MASEEIDFEGEGLLEGLEDADEREARLRLLRELADDGVELEELRQATASGRLMLLPVERALEEDGKRYTPNEIAGEVGLEVDVLERFLGALGMSVPDRESRVLGEPDLDAAKRVKAFHDAGLPEEGMLQVARTIGMATARIADANRTLIARELINEGDNEYDVAIRFAAAAKQMTPLVGPTLTYAMQMHLLERIRRDVIGAADLAAGGIGGASDAAVCFADLVDFTKLGEQVDAEELGGVVDRLEELASDAAKPPVRLVKMIGDAAMLVCEEPGALLDAGLKMIESAEQEGDEFPLLRAGVAFGPVIAQAGDVYGSPVNLASRITAIARPGSILASEAMTEAAGERFHYSFAGERRPKGITNAVKVFRVRREPKDV